jgi:hypothetical protein
MSADLSQERKGKKKRKEKGTAWIKERKGDSVD